MPAGTVAGNGDAEADDRTLLAAHLAGDAAAFGALFARHRDRLWAVALRTTGDREEAADALQEAMISAFRRADSYRGDAAVTTWLHRIVVNASLDRLRRRRSLRLVDAGVDHQEPGRAQLAESSASSGPGSGPGSGSDPVVAAERADRRQTVLQALGRLPEEQRRAVVLVDMEGYSIEETAQLLEVAPGTVKSRCSRGRARLRGLLEELDPAYGGQDADSRDGNPEGAASVASPEGMPTSPTGRPGPQAPVHREGGDR